MSDIVGEGMSDNGVLSDIEPGLNQTNRSDDLRTRLKAFARDCVLMSDMTPGAERQLNHILDDIDWKADE
jgi:hypothetical protein